LGVSFQLFDCLSVDLIVRVEWWKKQFERLESDASDYAHSHVVRGGLIVRANNECGFDFYESNPTGKGGVSLRRSAYLVIALRGSRGRRPELRTEFPCSPPQQNRSLL